MPKKKVSGKPKHILKPLSVKKQKAVAPLFDKEYFKQITRAYKKEFGSSRFPQTKSEIRKAIHELKPITRKPPTKQDLSGLSKKEQKNLIALRKLTVLTAKETRIVYRDKDTGRFSKLGKGNKVRVEIYRIKKMDDGTKKWLNIYRDKKLSRRKYELTAMQIAMILKKRLRTDKIRVEIVDGKVYIYTET